jgi:hypothetical protein
MACQACNNPIEEGGRVFQYPCCGAALHSLCAIQKIATCLSAFGIVTCPCGQVVYHGMGYYTDLSTEQIDAENAVTMAKPDAPGEMKAIETKRKLKDKACAQYRKYLKAKRAELGQVIGGHLSAIKEAKTAMATEVKSSEQYKTYRKLDTSYSLLKRKFQKKYDLRYYHMRRFFKYRRHWDLSPMYMFTRQFRIRL